MDLFRVEVVQARTIQWLGSVHLSQSTPFWIIALGAVLLAGALIAYGVFGSYAKKARVTGVLVSQGGEINIASPATGRISELRVREGQAVNVGDTLLVLDTDRTTAIAGSIGDTAVLVGQQIAARRATLLNEHGLRESQARLRRQAITDRLLAIDAELRKLDDEIALQKRRRDLAAQTVQRFEGLASSEYVSKMEAQQQQEALIDQDARLQALERTRLERQRDRTALVSEEREIGTQLSTELASVDRELASLNQEATENAARRSTVVAAPRAGTVTAVAIGAGQFVSAGQSLAAIQPAGALLEAHLFAPSRTVGFVNEGQPVLLRFAAYPYQKFGLYAGEVTSVSRSAFAPNELPPAFQTLFGRQIIPEALYRITVTLNRQTVEAYGKPQPLKPGMALEADIVQDRRRIIEWMLEPVFAFARRS